VTLTSDEAWQHNGSFKTPVNFSLHLTAQKHPPQQVLRRTKVAGFLPTSGARATLAV
jgi:hypothetical protein